MIGIRLKPAIDARRLAQNTTGRQLPLGALTQLGNRAANTNP